MGLTEKGVAKARRGALDWQLDGRRKRERGKNNGKKDKGEGRGEEKEGKTADVLTRLPFLCRRMSIPTC